MLVVDDDPRSRRLLEGYLAGEGYAVRSAEDGQSALDLARADPPDVVLLDVMMPGMTGHEVCEILKAEPDTRLSQVMLVTALDGTPHKVEGLDLGADDFVTKPVRREEFLAKVRALLRVRRSLVDLEEARRVLAERNEELQLKKALAQSLVHDLKNPLAAILGNLDLLEMKADPGLAPTIERSREGAQRMQKMIVNLLDIEALEEGQLEPALERVDAAALARACLEEAEAAARQRDVALRLVEEGPIWAEADGVLLRRIVDNLVANAIAHSPPGGTIEVAVRLREEGVEIDIADEGAGIPLEHRERVFDKYVRIGPNGGRAQANRGLGLTFCRLAVEAQGGTIWVEEARGGGARFRTLLAEAAPAAAGQPALV